MIFRAEKDGIFFFDSINDKTYILPAVKFDEVTGALAAGEQAIAALGLDPDIREAIRQNPQVFLTELRRCEELTPPPNAFSLPMLMNLELTTRCPLRCPQCYCDLYKGKDLSLDTALHFIRQAAALKIPNINLSGGETLVYPHLFELIEACAQGGLCAAVALSGYGFDEAVLNRMVQAGVGEIYISLNGSIQEVNAASRDGYDLAVNALKVLKNGAFRNYYVNWVAHKSNIEDFPNVVALCKEYGVQKLVIIGFKPDSSHSLASAPTDDQLLQLADFIRHHDGTPNILVESCFSPLRAVTSQKFFGNINRGITKGCGAGRDGISVNVDGQLTPCRHLEQPEAFDSIEDYWYHSKVLQQLRAVEDTPRTPCKECKYSAYCLHCMAINLKLNGAVYKGNETCGLWK